LANGQTAALAVSATVAPCDPPGLPSPLYYQWRAGATNTGVYTNLIDSSSISGSTSSTLTISGMSAANVGDYRVVITNSYGSATGGGATVTLTRAPPIIVTQPLSQSLYTGQAAQFTVAANGAPPLFYQWRAGATNSGIYTNVSDGSQVSGSTTTNLVISN